MTTRSRSRFVQGLMLGVLSTLTAGVLFVYARRGDSNSLANLPSIDVAGSWVYANLGLSLPLFGLLLCLYVNSLRKLKRSLDDRESIERIAQHDHLVDTWISLFFGVGVIWTAIGMRSALVFALGEPELTLNLGAYDILERMVRGGILVALSTTIVGGIGGYLLRVIKTLSVESDIKRYYDQMAHAPGVEIQATLTAIESHLKQLSQRPRL